MYNIFTKRDPFVIAELKQNVSLELTDIWGDLLFIHLLFLDQTANASLVSCNHLQSMHQGVNLHHLIIVTIYFVIVKCNMLYLHVFQFAQF